jgi:hypothetical protein
MCLSDGLIHEDREFEYGSAKREEVRAQDDGGTLPGTERIARAPLERSS